jgi:hypothetical protein
MTQFWLDNIVYLINTKNFNFNGVSSSERKIQMLNIIAMTSLITGLYFSYRKKNPKYFAIAILVMSITIFIKSNGQDTKTPVSRFANVQDKLSNSYTTGVYLVKNVNLNEAGLNNKLYVNEALNFNKGDIIALANNNTTLETNIISNVVYTPDNTPVLILLNPLKGNYSKYTTKILKVSDTMPDIIPPPDGNISIQSAGNNGTSDPLQMAAQNYPKFNLPNQNRNDWNLEQSSMVPGGGNQYVYQGQPYGNLQCRTSTVDNPMGTINVTEYDSPPTMYGTCNVAESTGGVLNDTVMTRNQEATVSQGVDDLLFHRGNSQMMFSPMPVDTLPDNQEAFANWVYNSPTNGVNVKYASVFVNDPAKYKIVAGLAKASGSENGGGGAR